MWKATYRTDCITANVMFDRVVPYYSTIHARTLAAASFKTLEETETANSITSSFYYYLVLVSLCTQVCTIPNRMQVLSNWILLKSIKMILFSAKRVSSVVHSSSPVQWLLTALKNDYDHSDLKYTNKHSDHLWGIHHNSQWSKIRQQILSLRDSLQLHEIYYQWP